MTRQIFTVTILCCLCVACDWLLYPYQEPTPKPNEDKALQIVKDTYEPFLGDAVQDWAPRVYWSDTVCPYATDDGIFLTAVIHNKKCFAGLTHIGGMCQVAWRGNFSKSAYAHELMHAYLNHTGHGDWVIDPMLPGAVPPSTLEPCPRCVSLVDEANSKLFDAGL